MASMSLLIAAHQKVDATVSSGLPGALVRGASAAARVYLTGRRCTVTFLRWDGGCRLTLSLVSRVLLSPTLSANLNITLTAEETSGASGRATFPGPPAGQEVIGHALLGDPGWPCREELGARVWPLAR